MNQIHVQPAAEKARMTAAGHQRMPARCLPCAGGSVSMSVMPLTPVSTMLKLIVPQIRQKANLFSMPQNARECSVLASRQRTNTKGTTPPPRSAILSHSSPLPGDSIKSPPPKILSTSTVKRNLTTKSFVLRRLGEPSTKLFVRRTRKEAGISPGHCTTHLG